MDLKEGKTSGFKSSSINETIHKIEIVSPFSFKIGDTTIYTPYERNGKITQVKVPKPFKFKSLAESLKPGEIPLDENMSIADFEKMPHINISHACFEALDRFQKKENRLPEPWNLEDGKTFNELCKEVAEEMKQEFDETWEKVCSLFCYTCKGTLNPLCAFIGGFLAQELIKAMTQKFSPIKQLFYFNSIEICPFIENVEETIKNEKLLPKDDRYDGLRVVIGETLLSKVQFSSIFMVGAGAIG